MVKEDIRFGCLRQYMCRFKKSQKGGYETYITREKRMIGNLEKIVDYFGEDIRDYFSFSKKKNKVNSLNFNFLQFYYSVHPEEAPTNSKYKTVKLKKIFANKMKLCEKCNQTDSCESVCTIWRLKGRKDGIT